MAVPVESADKLDNQAKRYQQLYILNTSSAATLTFITEHDFTGAI